MDDPLGITISSDLPVGEVRGETRDQKSLVRYVNDFVVFCKSEAAARYSTSR